MSILDFKVARIIDVFDFTSRYIDVVSDNPILGRFVLSTLPSQTSAIGAGNQMPRSAPAKPKVD